MENKIYQYKVVGHKRMKCPRCGKLGVFCRYFPENGGAFKHTYKLGFGGAICELIDVCFFNEKECQETFQTTNQRNKKRSVNK